MSGKVWRYARWLVSAAVGLAISAAVALYERETYPDYTPLRLISDGCFVGGVLLAGIGALVWISNAGGFSALSYAVYLIKRKRFSSEQKFEERLSYVEYVQVFGEKEKSRPGCIITTGLAFIAASCVFLILYWQ